jgi:sugar/nucleoside kinase (ribokinase family)
MKILLIGSSVEDTIHASGKVYHRPGGIYYSVLGLTSAYTPEELYLYTYRSDSQYYLFEEVYKNLRHDYIINTDKIPHIHLHIHDEGERTEVYQNITGKLYQNDLPDEFLKSLDGVYINMITGFEMSPDDIRELRKKTGAFIYMDIHSLTRDYLPDGSRPQRKLTNIKDWISDIDALQANEYEITTCGDSNEPDEIAGGLISAGLKHLFVTRGEEGADYYSSEDGTLKKKNFIPAKTRTVNKVGCGDVFGIVNFYTYLLKRDTEQSVITANKAAAAVAGFSDHSEFPGLRNII